VNLESVNLTNCIPLPAGDLVCGSMDADGTSLVRIGSDGGIEILVEPRGIGPHAGGPMVLDRQRRLVFFPNFARNVEGDDRPVFGVLRLSDFAFGETAINADWSRVMSLNETILSDTGHAFSGGRRVGADWAGERFIDQSVGTGGVAPFATGFGDDVMLAWLADDAQAGPGGGCFSIGGLRACDIAPTGATAGPKRIPHEVALIWQPIEEALTPGEVLFGGFADGFDEATGARRPPRWAVWKMTRTGAVTPWLDAAQFEALVQDPLVREDLAAHPLDQVDSLAVASNGLKFCFVERMFGRGWEVTLDPVRRVPASAAPFPVSLLGPSGGALACAYDERDRLAVVGGTGIAVGDEPVRPHALGNGVEGLLRTDAAWIAWGAPGPAVCLEDDGTTGTRPEAAAVTPLPFLPGHVAWIAPGTRAREIAGAVTGVATVEAFCTGADANEALEEPAGINLQDY